jgi:site-specific recombinase XerD
MRSTKKPAICPGCAAEITVCFLERKAVKSTQLAYPTPAHFAPKPPKSAAELAAPAHRLDELKLINGTIKNDIHHLRDQQVVLYKRPRSSVWQMRYKLFDRKWYITTTKYADLEWAKRAAVEIYDRARFKEEMGIPQTAKRYEAVALECSRVLQIEIERGIKPMTNRDYLLVIRKYLIPFFGKYHIHNIDAKLVREFETWRNEIIGHMPVASTLATHCAAFNRIVDTAIERGWLSPQVPIARLSRRGPKSKARPGFTKAEADQMLSFMVAWSEGGPRLGSTQMRLLLRDYVEVLLATGMRCGKESMNMLWQHIEWYTDKDGQRYLRIWVDGKTGGRWLIAKHRAAEALGRLAERQHAVSMSLEEAIAAQLPVHVFTLDDGSQPYGLAGTFKRMLEEAGLLLDKSSGQRRTLYSLRHHYATMELLSGMDVHTLARQMGTSILMLEKHYSKLTATMAAGRLA